MKMKLLSSVSFAVAVGLASIPASAETFRAATWNGANSANDKFLNDFSTQVGEKSNGAMKFEVYPGGSLLPAKGTLEGIQNGVAHLANITAAYIPSKMPVDFVTADMSFIADDQMALAFAKTEVAFFNEQMQKELQNLDIVFATGFSIGIYNLICGFEAKSAADFNGRKVRTSSDAQVEFIDRLGGVAVSAPANEIYTGIQRGTLDCTAGTPLFLTDFFKLSEVAKSVYLIPLGSNANGGYYFSQDFWQSRSEAERRILLDAMADATASSMTAWSDNIDKAWKASMDAGIDLVQPETEALEALTRFTAEYVPTVATTAVEKRGIEDPTPLINDFTAAVKKWKGLLAGIDRNDSAAVAGLLKQEIFNKVDVKTYGMN